MSIHLSADLPLMSFPAGDSWGREKGQQPYMLEYIMIGSGFAFAAVLQPGPLQAYLLNSVARNGWKNTLPASFSPLISDGPIVLISLFILNQVPDILYGFLRIAGGVFLIFLAWMSYRKYLQYNHKPPENHPSAPRTILQAAFVNLLNPNPYLSWSLVMGPTFLAALNQKSSFAVGLISAFYITMIGGLALTIILFGTSSFLGPRRRRGLIMISALLLAGLGVYQLVVGMMESFSRF